MAKTMGKRTTTPASQYRQIDMRDWLMWMDAAYTLAVAAGQEHRQVFTITTHALAWDALKERMLAAGLHELGDAPLFRAAKTLYLQTESETRCAR